MKKYGVMAIGLLAAAAVFADDVVPTQDFISALIQGILSAKGMGTLMIVGLAVQMIIMFLKTPLFGSLFHNLDGKWKLALVGGLTLAGTLVSQVGQGMTILQVLSNSVNLTALMVFLNEIYQNFFAAKPTAPPAA